MIKHTKKTQNDVWDLSQNKLLHIGRISMLNNAW